MNMRLNLPRNLFVCMVACFLFSPAMKLEAKDRLAVFDFKVLGDVPEKDAGLIVAEYVTAKLNDQYDVFERGQLNQLLKEQKLRMSDLFDNTDAATQFGKLKGIRYLVIGSLSRLGNNYILSARAVDCETGQIGQRAAATCTGLEDIPTRLDTLLANMGLLATETAQKLDKPKAETARGPVAGQSWAVPEVGMEFVWIPTMKMWVGKYEVTNGEYRKFKPDHDSKDMEGNSLNGDRQPVAYVNFDDANEYASWLTQRKRGAGRLPDGMVYRLPTKDEWTTFAQCGDGRKCPWGNEWPPKYGNYRDRTANSTLHDCIGGGIKDYDDGSAVSCPVEKSGKNDWGLFGIGGNVWECTSVNPGGSFDAWRGGGWQNGGNTSCLHRASGDDLATRRINDFGFRLVLSR